jgi:alkanesulfonate monooxygenase SsuD/methylene tetrahydromethanopterin reductase-like flavin-dependent oxidoreductase (luciferase family)
MEGWITLTALLQETERLRGGVLVTGMLYRHPGVLANMASTLDITSGGRLELGVGAGWNEEECEAYGIDLGTMKQRFDRFEEGLAVLTGLLTRDRTTFEGRYYRLTDAMNNPKGPQQPLPICIGGAGLRRTLPLVARYAHHWNYGSPQMSIEDFRMRLEVLHKACAAEGRDPAEITVSTLFRYTGNVDEMVAEAAAYRDAGVDLGIIVLPKTEDPSLLGPIAEALAPLSP